MNNRVQKQVTKFYHALPPPLVWYKRKFRPTRSFRRKNMERKRHEAYKTTGNPLFLNMQIHYCLFGTSTLLVPAKPTSQRCFVLVEGNRCGFTRKIHTYVGSQQSRYLMHCLKGFRLIVVESNDGPHHMITACTPFQAPFPIKRIPMLALSSLKEVDNWSQKPQESSQRVRSVKNC